MDAKLLICRECGSASDRRAGKPGDLIRASIESSSLSQQIGIEETGCMNVCDNPVTVALQGNGRATCIFAGVDAAEDIESIIATCRLYLDSPKGWIKDARGCGDLRFKLVARVPALT